MVFASFQLYAVGYIQDSILAEADRLVNRDRCRNIRKNRKDMYQILRPFMDFAIANAKRLEEINRGKLPSKAAPGTKIHELVEKLKPYL